MTTEQPSDLTFLTEAMACITSSLDIQKSLIQTFDFLAHHFPIEAISLHQFSAELQSVKLLFLVRAGRFDFIEKAVPLTDEETGTMAFLDTGMIPIKNLPSVFDMPAVKKCLQSFPHSLTHQDRGALAGILQSSEETVGHLSLLGTHKDCFNTEHERKFAMLLTPFTLTMANLLKYKRTMAFQESLYAENRKLQKGLARLREKRVIGDLGGLKETMDVVHQLEGREIPALILGETGTGKELLADTIHHISPRKEQPFIKVNCGAIPDTLVDSELFGYEKGAFTGATKTRPGKFEQANGGTLFLDEVGELPPHVQVRLLRVLQNNVVERIGSTNSINVDVRIIAATNRNLEQMVQDGAFREDLYYRLFVYPINVPPLRERVQDLPELVHFFLKQSCEDQGIQRLPQIPFESMQRLLQHPWPGNIRELENLIKRGVTLSPTGPLHLAKLLPPTETGYSTSVNSYENTQQDFEARVEAILDSRLSKLSLLNGKPASQAASCSPKPAVKTMDTVIREAIMAALEASQGKIHGSGGAAELLDMNPSTLRGKIRKMGLKTGKK